MHESRKPEPATVQANLGGLPGSVLRAAYVEVAAASTGLMGGNHTHGGESVLHFADVGSTTLWVSVNGLPPSEVQSIHVGVGGDVEIEDLIAGLKHAVKTLEAARDGFFPVPPAR